MIDLEKYRDPAIAQGLIRKITELADRPVSLMEVCGTHTMAISQFGIRGLLPASVRLLSGPGCPVCVTALADIDRMIALAGLPGVILATFGDMIRVPGSRSSLRQARSDGAGVRVVYSPLDALSMATENPAKQVVFAGVGFETTSPAIAATVVEAKARGIANFSVYPAFKLVPPALRMILESRQSNLSGFILPGHVSAIIGSRAYDFIASDYQLPGVVAGFEPLDILEAIVLLLAQIRDYRQKGSVFSIQNEYSRGVPANGNQAALAVLDQVMEPCDAEWRAIGVIPGSGLRFRQAYHDFDARRRFTISIEPPRENPACRCGRVMLGLIDPNECELFGTSCTPDEPEGPCMVSSEGACAAWYKYGEPSDVEGLDSTGSGK